METHRRVAKFRHASGSKRATGAAVTADPDRPCSPSSAIPAVAACRHFDRELAAYLRCGLPAQAAASTARPPPRRDHLVGGLIVRAIAAWQRRVARARHLAAPQTGAITFVKRLGGLVHLHFHFHFQLLVPDGVFTPTDPRRPRVRALARAHR